MSLFGEIFEPTSRTNWEDWDEIIPESDGSKLQWQHHIEINTEVDTFYFIDGKYLKQFLNIQSPQVQLVNNIKEVDLNLYKINTLNKYLCTIKDYSVMLSSEIVLLLQPYLKICKKVITIQTVPIVEYRSHQLHTQPCVIRGVYTSKAASSPIIEYPKLEQPNIISGIPAGVLTLREHLDLMAVALICYIEYTEDYQVEDLQKLINRLDIGSIFQTSCSTTLSSNLYI